MIDAAYYGHTATTDAFLNERKTNKDILERALITATDRNRRGANYTAITLKILDHQTDAADHISDKVLTRASLNAAEKGDTASVAALIQARATPLSSRDAASIIVNATKGEWFKDLIDIRKSVLAHSDKNAVEAHLKSDIDKALASGAHGHAASILAVLPKNHWPETMPGAVKDKAENHLKLLTHLGYREEISPGPRAAKVEQQRSSKPTPHQTIYI